MYMSSDDVPVVALRDPRSTFVLRKLLLQTYPEIGFPLERESDASMEVIHFESC